MKYYFLIRLSQSIYGVENTNSSVLMWAIGSMMRGSVSQMNAFVLRFALSAAQTEIIYLIDKYA
jgi:hypothetical protein